jgi:hypothetical protein
MAAGRQKDVEGVSQSCGWLAADTTFSQPDMTKSASVGRDVCFCSKISPPCRSREHPRPILLQANRLCCHVQEPVPGPSHASIKEKSFLAQIPSALACALSLPPDKLWLQPAANVLAGPSTDDIGCSRRVKGWLFISPFNRTRRHCPRVEAQVMHVSYNASHIVDIMVANDHDSSF